MTRQEYNDSLTELTKIALHSLIISYYGFQNDGLQPVPEAEDLAQDAVSLARAAMLSIEKSTQDFNET